MTPSEAGVPAVVITDAVRDARQMWRTAGDDLLNQEVAATYACIGELLDSGRDDEEYVREVQDLVGRLVNLDREQQRQTEQRWAAWMARSMDGGVGEQ